MSSTLLAMKDLLVKNGIALPGEKDKPGPSSDKNTADVERETGKETIDTRSETTIYRNALDKIVTRDEMVDSEITFRVWEVREKPEDFEQMGDKRESSSSEEPIDTSDELIEAELGLDINDKFIADCVAEAKKMKLAESKKMDPRVEAENMI